MLLTCSDRVLLSAKVLLWDQPQLVAKIADFGPTTGPGGCSFLASMGTMRAARSTMLYRPPEAFQGRPFTTASDVYAYGIVLWEMLTGSRPWAGYDDAALMRLVLGNHRPPLKSTLRNTALGRLAKRCWTHRPASRPTFRDLEAELSVAVSKREEALVDNRQQARANGQAMRTILHDVPGAYPSANASLEETSCTADGVGSSSLGASPHFLLSPPSPGPRSVAATWAARELEWK